MKMIRISDVIIRDRKRPLKDIESLKQSIKEVGLINPITVYRNNILVAGYHRLEACRALGWKEIPAMIIKDDNVTAEMAQIDENIIRKDLTVIEEADQLLRRKELYEIRYPNSLRPFKVAQNLKQFADAAKFAVSVETFTEDASLKTGKSVRTIRELIQIAAGIHGGLKDMIKGHPMENNKQGLLMLARLKCDIQKRKLVQKVLDGEFKTLRTAILSGRTQNVKKDHVPTRAYKKLYKAYADLELKYIKLEEDYEKLKKSNSSILETNTHIEGAA